MAHNVQSDVRGYWVVAASFLALMAAPLSLSLPTLGLFILPVSQEFGWERATFSLGPSLGSLVAALAAPFLGAFADKWGSRPVLATGVILYAASVASLGLLQGSLILYLAISVVLYTSGQVQTSAIYSRVASTWFDKKRGLMIAIATSGLAAGGIITPIIGKAVMDMSGWRVTYFALGLFILLVALPPILGVVRERRESDLPDQARQASALAKGISLSEAARTPTFWKILGIFFMAPFAMTGLAANLIPMLTGRGLALDHAVLAVSAIALSQAVGRVVSGAFLDRFPFPQISVIWFAGAGVGIAMLYVAYSPLLAIAAAALIGLAWGAEGEICGYYVSRYFGLYHFARIAGALFMALGIAASASIYMVGWLFDVSGGYTGSIAISVCAMVVACGLLLALEPYRFPPHEH
ncbi:MFS transporter [Sphingobium ummariense]